MSQLDSYFHDEAVTSDNPLIRFFTNMEAKPDFLEAKVKIVRPRTPLGYKPAKLYVHFYAKSGGEMDAPHREDWDDEINTALIEHKVKAITVENEKVRFALGLRAALKTPETRFGDGYYNGVLVHHIKDSEFKDVPEVAEVLEHVDRNGFESSSRAYIECSQMIDWEIRERARELTKNLGYEISEAKTILAGAVAQYLDDRFSVTYRRNLGWL